MDEKSPQHGVDSDVSHEELPMKNRSAVASINLNKNLDAKYEGWLVGHKYTH